MPEYTIWTAVAIVAVVGVEVLWWRTGVFTSPRYWISMIIVWGFQVLVDGWLTRLSAPIVRYDDAQTLGVRWPWDIPIEDFGFGFAMVTLTIMGWVRHRDRGPRRRRRSAGAAPPRVIE